MDLPKDHDYLAGLRQCLQSSPHLDMTIGLMHGRGVRFVHVDGETVNKAKWAAIIVQGEPDITVLREVARRMEEKLDEERIRLREDGLKG